VDYIKIATATTELCFDAEKGYLEKVVYGGREIPMHSKLWSVDTNQGALTIEKMSRFYVQSYDGVRKLFWENDAAKVCVTLRVRDEKIRWNIVAELFDGSTVGAVQFPILEGLKFQNDNYLLLTWQNGHLLKNPIEDFLAKGEEVQSWVGRGTYAFESEYPAGLSFQYTTFYSPSEYGYYFCTEDGEAYIKTYRYEYNHEKDAMNYILINYPENMGKAVSYYMPYDFVTQLFEGDWQTATNIYREWAVAQKWCAKRLTEKKLPETVTKTDLWRINHHNFDLGTRTQEYFDTSVMLRDALDCNLALHWYGWNMRGFHGEDYPDYISDEKKAEGWPAKLKEWNEKFTAEGISKIPFTNARLWEYTSKTFKSCNVAASAIKNENGEIPEEYWGDRVDLRPVCPATGMWQNKVVDYCREYIADCAFDGVYLDQIASYNATLCFDETHPHPLGGGNWWNNSYHTMINNVRALLGDDKILTTESCCETYMDVLDLFLVLDTNMQHTAFNSLVMKELAVSVPLFSMIYGEHALSYGSVCKVEVRLDRFEYNMVRNVLWGILPCIEGFTMEQLKSGTEYVKIVKRAVDFYKAHKDVILYGRLSEVPEYTCETFEMDWQGVCDGKAKGEKFSYISTLPTINAVIWNKPDGKKVLFAYNYSDSEQTMEMGGKTYTVAAKSFAEFAL